MLLFYAQMPFELFTFAIRRVDKPRCGRLHVSCGAIIANMHPQPGLFLPFSGSNTGTGMSSVRRLPEAVT